jgi:hypothetical protein
MSYKFPASASRSATFVDDVVSVMKAARVATQITNLIIEKHKLGCKNEKKVSLQLKTDFLVKMGFAEKDLTQTAQFIGQMLKGAGFTVTTCGFPWADAAHTEYLSTETMYITASK